MQNKFKFEFGEINTSEDLVRIIDNLKFAIKMGNPELLMIMDFNGQLNNFIHRWQLNQDPHAFASLPKKTF